MTSTLIRPEGDGPIYLRVYRGLRTAILDGRIARGSPLPSSRALASELGVSRNVILAAFDQLLAEGYVEGRLGSGTYVSQSLPELALQPHPARPAAPAPRAPLRLSRHARQVVSHTPSDDTDRPHVLYDFRYGEPALEEFPHAVWSKLVTERVRRLSVQTLARVRARGFEPLRQAVLAYLRRARGVRAELEQVLIVNGTQQGLDLAARMLIDRGDRVVIEEPSYQVAREVFLGFGARLVPVPVDADGLQSGRLPGGRAVRLAYITPSHQFPLGGVLPIERRIALLHWAEHTGAYVLEDDYDSEFRYDTQPVEAVQGLDQGGRVLYMGSFSKVLFPALRIGYLVVPPELVPVAAALKFLTDRATPSFEQEVLADFLAEGHFERHLHRMRVLYGARRRILLESLREAFGARLEIFGADAGLHVVIQLRGLSEGDVPAVVARAAASGVGIYPVAPCYQRPPRRAGLLLGYAGLNERELRAGVQLFAEAVAASRA